MALSEKKPNSILSTIVPLILHCLEETKFHFSSSMNNLRALQSVRLHGKATQLLHFEVGRMGVGGECDGFEGLISLRCAALEMARGHMTDSSPSQLHFIKQIS